MGASMALALGGLLLTATACDGGAKPGTAGTGGQPGNTGGNASTGGAASTDGAPAPAPGGTDPALTMIQAQIDAAHVDKTRAGWRTSLRAPTLVTFTAGRSYVWKLVTSKGELRLRLRPDVAPMHVTSTIYLTLLGFYDSLTFHRIIKGFMAQGGDPNGNGSGTPGYSYAREISASAKHDKRGVLSMANAGDNTEGSQFFITFAPQPRLDGGYSVFGNLIAGDETLTAIEAGGVVREGEGTPEIVTITSATIMVE